MTYADKLLDPRWQRVRLEVMSRDEWKCRQCGAEDKTLHVHHRSYVGSDPWDTPPRLLETLCEDCHGRGHAPRPLDPEAVREWREDIERRLGVAVTDVRELLGRISALQEECGKVAAEAVV